MTTPVLSSHQEAHGRRRFCPMCGVSPFRIPRSDPEKSTVNARCLDGVEVESLIVDYFDGRHWEDAMRAERGPDWHE